MRIDRLYVERAAESLPATRAVLSKLEARETLTIENYQDFFSRRTTHYLEKRNTRSVFIAIKRGSMVKEAPPAYGYGTSDLHYYYVHAYNCVYECEYCYLQGYFNSPDLVFFVNHDDALREMQQIADQYRGTRRVWFHAGEFSDSLALSHISGELSHYWKFFAANPHCSLELRSKSVNLTVLRSLTPLPNTIASFSLATESQAALFDHKAPSVKQRLAAMRRLKDMGFHLAVHLDPIIYQADFTEQIEKLAGLIEQTIGYEALEYVSVGAIRFAKDVYRAVRQNYPDSQMFARHFIQSRDTKMRYIRPLRLQLIETAQAALKKHGCPEEKIYICME